MKCLFVAFSRSPLAAKAHRRTLPSSNTFFVLLIPRLIPRSPKLVFQLSALLRLTTWHAAASQGEILQSRAGDTEALLAGKVSVKVSEAIQSGKNFEEWNENLTSRRALWKQLLSISVSVNSPISTAKTNSPSL